MFEFVAVMFVVALAKPNIRYAVPPVILKFVTPTARVARNTFATPLPTVKVNVEEDEASI